MMITVIWFGTLDNITIVLTFIFRLANKVLSYHNHKERESEREKSEREREKERDRESYEFGLHRNMNIACIGRK